MSYNEAWRNEVLTKEDTEAILASDAENAREVDGNVELAKHLWNLNNIECDGDYI